MSLAEEMLATMPLSDDSSTYSADEEPHIVINESRQAIVPNELKTIAVTGDKDIETVTFDCVRYWDGNDLSTFAIFLNYVLPDLTTGTYIPEKITTTDGDEFYHFVWQIKNNITKKSGKISFAVTAVKTKQNESGETVVDKQWSSLPNGDCSIALGLGISNVPAEEESSDVVAQLSAILEQIHADVDEWIKTVVVQTTGTSQTQVMSQNAVTSSLNSYKEESIQQSNVYTDSKYNLLDKKILQNSNKISRDSKRITNLEQGLPSEQFMTDSTVAYTKDVPSNALPYASINMIGGASYKTENLIPFPYYDTSSTLKGVTITVGEKGGITLDGETTADSGFSFIANANNNVDGIFTLSTATSGSVSGGNPYLQPYIDGTAQAATNLNATRSYNLKGNLNQLSMFWKKGTVFTNFVVYPMLNEGSTAKPYTPYFEGLRSAKVTEVKSVGANLMLPLVEGTFFGVTFKKDANGVYHLSGTATADITRQYVVNLPKREYSLTLNHSKTVGAQATNSMYIVGRSASNSWLIASYAFLSNTPSIADVEIQNIIFVIHKGVNVDGVTIAPMLNAGSTAQPYTPYVEHILPIPEAALALEGDGQGNPDDPAEYNAIIWGEYGTNQYLQKGNIVDGVWYALSTHEVTDISDLLPADTLISVEGGGTLTFENEYGYAVPSEVEYQVEV